MLLYRLTQAAGRDLQEIARYGIQNWGEHQAEAYLANLEAAFIRLGQFPLLGREVSYIRAGYRRAEHGQHSIFYRQQSAGVLVVRVLYRSVEPSRRL